jgi:EAL domain-containing protein (putative c-di-GMP-specific phosphodiesterase class I)
MLLILWAVILYPTSAIALITNQAAQPLQLLVSDETKDLAVNGAIPTALGHALERPTDFTTNLYSESILPSPNVYWHKFTIKADFDSALPKKRFYILLKTNVLRHLDVFIYADDHLVNHAPLGLLDDKTTNVSGTHYPLVDFTIHNQQELTVYIRKQTDSPAIMPFTILSEEGYEEDKKVRYIATGGFLCIFLLLGLYNTGMGLLSKNRAFNWYIVFYVYSFVIGTNLTGIGYIVWPVSMHEWLASNNHVVNFFGLTIALLLIRSFLNLKGMLPKLYIISSYLIVMAAAGFVLSFFIAEYNIITFFFIFQIIVSSFILYSAAQAIMIGYKPAKLLFVAWMVLIICSVIGTGTYLNLFPVNFFTLNAFIIGAIFELSILSLALTDLVLFARVKALNAAYSDPITELPTYSYLLHIYESELKDTFLKQGEQLWFVLFKTTDTSTISGVYGHKVISAAYKNFIARVEQYLAEDGHALAIPLPEDKSGYIVSMPDGQMMFIGKTRSNTQEPFLAFVKELNKPLAIADSYANLHVSLGLANIVEQKGVVDNSLGESYRCSQVALNRAISQGQEIVFYSKTYDEENQYAVDLLKDIVLAIESREFTFHIQPQYDFKHQLIGGEVLIRWVSQKRGFVSPVEFIPLAESVNLIHKITQVVIEKSFSWLSENQQYLAEEFHLSLNLSADDLYEPNLIEYIAGCAQRHGVSAGRVVFEVTETASSKKMNAFVDAIISIKASGYGVALDDFGTGYSSLSYMQMMQPDIVKIDMSFVRDIDKSFINKKIITAICQMASSTEAKTVAEGIETMAEYQELEALGVDYIQGYLKGKPVPMSDFVDTYVT